MAGMAQSQFDINAKVQEVQGLRVKIVQIGESLEQILRSAPPHLEEMIRAYFGRIDKERRTEEGKIQGIEENIGQYRDNLQRISDLNTQKAEVNARIEAIRRQIDEESAKQYTPQTAGGSKKRRKINPTTKMKIKKSSMKIKSSKSKDIRKIKKNKDKK
jgi:hypothetical protein